METISTNKFLALIAAFVLCVALHSLAQTKPASTDSATATGPPLPCGSPTIPDYPDVNAAAVLKSWSRGDLGSSWQPPACTTWTEAGFSTLITLAARFSFPSGEEGLLRRIGAISQLNGLQYWSTTHKQWQTLVLDAYAISGPPPAERRADFSPDEMSQGKALYFEQADNIGGKAPYRLKIIEAKADRVVFAIENTDAVHYRFLTIFHPQELQSIYFLDRESDQVWRFYAVQRIGKKASRLAGNESSSMNRAAAFYRHLAGIPPNQEPPAAR